MKKIFYGIIVVFLLSNGLLAQEEYQPLTDLGKAIDSLRGAEADVFAPATFKKAEEDYLKAWQLQQNGKPVKTFEKYVSSGLDIVQDVVKTVESVKLGLEDYLEPRQKAKNARAAEMAGEEWREAEGQFLKATGKIEGGDVKGGLKEAEKAAVLFDTAELEAVREKIVGTADKYIEEAREAEADKFALTTLDRAANLRMTADTIIIRDRYNIEEAEAVAEEAEYEARHAENIARSIKVMDKNDQAWERIILLYENQMSKAAESVGIKRLPFDEGPQAAADSLSRTVSGLMQKHAGMVDTLREALKFSLSRTGIEAGSDDLLTLVATLDGKVKELVLENGRLRQESDDTQDEIARLEQEHNIVAGELEKRLDREQRIAGARSLFSPIEADVVLSPADDIVLRLFGLSFASGSSEITEEHAPLLDKVIEVLKTFPDRELIIEGHTDNRGDLVTNKRLSENRALAVMNYLRQAMGIEAAKITAIGYGPEKPIASNENASGRAKNRRIDILILK